MRHILPTTLTACLLVACATGGGVSPDTVAAGIARQQNPHRRRPRIGRFPR